MLKKQIILYKCKREIRGEEKRSVCMAQIYKIIIYNYIF